MRSEVEWQYQRLEAAHVARHTKVVSDVVNLISVKPEVSAVDVERGVGAALIATSGGGVTSSE